MPVEWDWPVTDQRIGNSASRKHQGKQRTGKGSLFTVEKPIDREVYSEQEIVESSPLPVQDRETDISAQEEKPCILFIDDNKDLQELIYRIFSKRDQTLTAESALQGLELLKSNPVDKCAF